MLLIKTVIKNIILTIKNMPKPATWKTCVKITEDPEKNPQALLDNLNRLPKIQEEYNDGKKDVKDNYTDIRNFILINKFKCEWSLDIKGKKKAINIKKVPNTSYIGNSYPYNLEKGIVHDLIWSKKALSFNDIKDVITKKHKWEMLRREFIFWENPAQVKSIPEFLHYHVLWRKR